VDGAESPAANLLDQPDVELGGYAAALAGGDGLTALRVDADRQANLRATFDASYRPLPADAAWVFRLLGIHSGPDCTAAAVASLAGLPLARAEELLADLVRGHLVEERVAGRYALHDLLQAYAAEVAAGTDAPEELRAATHRLLDHYLHRAYAATVRLEPYRSMALVDAGPGVTPERPGDYAHALAWFTAERTVLLAAVDHAAATGFDRHAWQLFWTMTVFLDRQGHWRDWVVALAATERLGDAAAQADAHRYLSGAHMRLRDFDDALRHLGRAQELYRQIGDTLAWARTNRNLAQIFKRQGRYADAVEHARQTLDLYRAADHRRGQAGVLNDIGWYCALLGDYQSTIDYCEQALALQEELDLPLVMADTLDSLGYAHHRLGRYPDAVAYYLRAADLYRTMANPYNEADTLAKLAKTLEAAGDPDADRACRHRFDDLLAHLDHADAARLRIDQDPARAN
jgi:tetratricopeptide (TPR) repeat protein